MSAGDVAGDVAAVVLAMAFWIGIAVWLYKRYRRKKAPAALTPAEREAYWTARRLGSEARRTVLSTPSSSAHSARPRVESTSSV